MNFSFILNSRGRVKLLSNLLQSIVDTASNMADLEVLICIDDDDTDTIKFSREARFPITIKYFCVPRPKSLNTSLTWLAKQANGKYIFNINDDVVITTKDWDSIILSKISEFKKSKFILDDIIYCGVNDTSIDKAQGGKYASFPIISKEAVDVTGVFMYPDFVGLGGDSSIYRVYEAIDRVLRVPEVVLDHVGHNNIFSIMTPDLTAHEMRQNTYVKNIDPFTYDVSKEVEALKNYIQGDEDEFHRNE